MLIVPARPPHVKRTAFDDLVGPVVRKYFYDADLEAMNATYAAIAAHDLQTGPPVWPMLVAPPGSAKTTVLQPLESLSGVHSIDKLTPNTFLSGQIVTNPKHPPSLLHRIGPSGTVVFADFSTVLGMKRDDRAGVLADLRRIFDGRLRKEVGTEGGAVEWSGRLTVAVAVTPDIDRHYAVFQSLGERFVIIRWNRPGGDDSGEQAAIAAMNQNPAEVRERLALFVDVLLTGLPVDEIAVPEMLQRRIAALAEFVVHARTHVARDSSHNKNLLYLPEAEAPTRLAQQLCQLARGAARLRRSRTVNDADFALVRRVGFDCIPRLRWRIVRNCMNRTADLIRDIPRPTLSYQREDLRLVGLLDSEHDLSALAAGLLDRAGVHQMSPTNVRGKKERKAGGRRGRGDTW